MNNDGTEYNVILLNDMSLVEVIVNMLEGSHQRRVMNDHGG